MPCNSSEGERDASEDYPTACLVHAHNIFSERNQLAWNFDNLNCEWASELTNEFLSSVFTRENISVLPVPETKLEGRQSNYLGQLILTPKNGC